LKQQNPSRSAEEKVRTKDEANRKLSSLFPGLSSTLETTRNSDGFIS
jgi:hypothetical protein